MGETAVDGCEHGTPVKTWCDVCDDLVYRPGQVICPQCYEDIRDCEHGRLRMVSSVITPPPPEEPLTVERLLRVDLSRPDDLRAAGWMVAVHNDYHLDGEFHTFWLFTKGGRCVKGEGRTDLEALTLVRAGVSEVEVFPPNGCPTI